MPDTVSENYCLVEHGDLAEMLDRTSAAVSQAVRRTHFCAGYPVFEWAEWHPNGKQVMHYKVPVPDLKVLLPEDEYAHYGIFDL